MTSSSITRARSGTRISASSILGRLDPKTGAHAEFPLPELKQGYPVGTLDLETDKAGNLWIGMMFQGAIAKFDPKTEKFQFYPMPKDQNNNVTQLNMLGLRISASTARSGPTMPATRKSTASISPPGNSRPWRR